MAYGMFRVGRGVPRLADLAPPEPGRWPRLSVIVPACNEADEIEAAARTLLAEDYPDLEIIFVDDRSTDATGAIIDRLAAEDGRAKAIHVAALPDGWLGKVHALHTGLGTSTGEFVLFTDADVHFERGVLRQAIAYAEAERLDHLTALPNLKPNHLLLDATIASFIRQFLSLTRPWAVRNPDSRAFLGVGAFNLVRRSAFDATPGFEWLRMEVADDMGLGLMMKRSGARCGVAAAFGQVSLHWYRSLWDAVRGAEKAAATIFQFSLLRAVVLALLVLGLEWAPVLTLVPLGWPETRWIGGVGLATLAAYFVSAGLMRRWARARWLPVLLSPVVALLNAAAMIRAGWLGRRRGGLVWRGTLYPAAQFRGLGRVRFP